MTHSAELYEFQSFVQAARTISLHIEQHFIETSCSHAFDDRRCKPNYLGEFCPDKLEPRAIAVMTNTEFPKSELTQRGFRPLDLTQTLGRYGQAVRQPARQTR